MRARRQFLDGNAARADVVGRAMRHAPLEFVVELDRVRDRRLRDSRAESGSAPARDAAFAISPLRRARRRSVPDRPR